MSDDFDFDFSVNSEPSEEGALVLLRRRLDRLERALEVGDEESAREIAASLAAEIQQVGKVVPEGTLGEERERLMKERFSKEGCTCRACDQKVKVYPLSFSTNNASALIWMRRYDDAHPGEYVHVPSRAPKFMGKDGEFARMAYWGLIEQAPNLDDPTKPRSGMWRITARGRDFADGRSTLQETFLRYNSVLLGFEGALIALDDALPFDYRDLWSVDLSSYADTHAKLLASVPVKRGSR